MPKPHGVPDAHLIIDGERHEPSRISDFDGRPLYSTPSLTGKGDPVLYSFTSLQGLHDHLLQREGESEVHDPDSLPDEVRYWEHANFEGDWLWNGPGRGWRDLSEVPRGVLGLGDWNDIISSVHWCRWDITLYEHANYAGSWLYLRAGRTSRWRLLDLGWNDRASSTWNWGRRF